MMGSRLPGAFAMASLLVVLGCSNPLEDDDHGEAVGVDITDLAGAPLASYRTSTGVWAYTPSTSDALEVAVGASREVRIFFVTADGDRFQEPASGAELTHRVVIGNEAVVEYHAEDDRGRFEGLSSGQTTATVELVHGGHADYSTNPGMTVRVVGAP